jgi:hypothetical protein
MLYWGGMMFAFFAVIGLVISHFTMREPLRYEYSKLAITALIMFPAGAVFGWFLWRHAERNRRTVD